MNIIFAPDGTATCIYTEDIDLRSIGTLEVARETTIEHNNILQIWEVKDKNGKVLFSEPSRDTCLLWERTNL